MKRTGAKEVDDDDGDEAHGDPDGGVYFFLRLPEGHEDGCGGELGGEGERPGVPVIPAHREREVGGDETFCELDETASDRQEGDHLAEGDLDTAA